MGIKKIFIPMLCVIIWQGCRDKGTKPCLRTAYGFEVDVKLSPEGQVFHVGDSILFSTSFSKSLFDLKSGNMIDYSNSTGISGNIGIVLLDSINKDFIPSKDSFEFVNQIGFFSATSINQSTSIQYNVTELADKYDFKSTLVCKGKGVYYISVDDAGSVGLFGKNCTNSAIRTKLQIINHNEILYSNSIGSPPFAEALSRMFCIRVI
jgi:hypothetical protein